MNKIILLSVLMLVAATSYSQDKGYIAISLGTSTPIGDFASKDADNKAAGYATTGAVFDISFGYKFGKNFGMSALLRGQANGTDAQALADELVKQNPGISATVNSKTWSIGGYMLGGYISFPISATVSFDTRVMFGFLTATSPELTVNMYSSSGTGWVRQNSVSSSTFATLLGVGFKYDVGRRICLLANFDYLGAKPEFRNVETTTSNGSRSTSTWSQSFGTINIGVGVGYRL